MDNAKVLAGRLRDCIADRCVPLPRDCTEAADLIEQQAAEIAALRADAERYRWLRSRVGLELRSLSQPCRWKREDGTWFDATHYLAEGGMQHATAEGLDATIQAAMAARSNPPESPDSSRGLT